MNQPDPTPVFQLRGSMLAITVLELEYNDLDRLDWQLAAKVERAPQFFSNAPVILALDKLPSEASELDLAALMMTCYKHGLCTLAIRAKLPQHIEAANRLNLPVLPPSGAPARKLNLPEEASPSPTERPAEQQAPTPPPIRPKTRVITHPIRGGQQVYAQGDLIVLAPVSPGAELLAEGNIHVYAPLRGRALAGAKGDVNAHIFCKQLAAEMLSIAGRYKVAEDLRRNPEWGSAAHISLTGDMLNIRRL